MSPRARGTFLPILLLLLILSTPFPTVEGFSYGQWRTLFSLAHPLMNRVANLRASRGDLAGAARARTIAETLEGGSGFWSDMLGVASEMAELSRALNDLTRMKSDKDRRAWVIHNYPSVLRVLKSLFGRSLRMSHQLGPLSPLRELVLTIQSEAEGDYMKNYAWRDMAWSDILGVASEMAELWRAVNDLTRIKPDKDRGAWVLHNYQSVLGVLKSPFGRFLRMSHQSGPLRELVLTIQREVEGDLLRDCLELGTNDFKGLLQVAKEIVTVPYFTSERSDL